MQAGEIDLGVHSSKDMATKLPDGLELAAFLEREDIRDAFVSLYRQDRLTNCRGAQGWARRRSGGARRCCGGGPTSRSCRFAAMSTRGCESSRDGIADATLLAVAGLKRLGGES